MQDVNRPTSPAEYCAKHRTSLEKALGDAISVACMAQGTNPLHSIAINLLHPSYRPLRSNQSQPKIQDNDDQDTGPAYEAFGAVLAAAIDTLVSPLLTQIVSEFGPKGLSPARRALRLGQVINSLWKRVRAELNRALKHADIVREAGEEIVNELKLPAAVVVASGHALESAVAWRPPAADAQMQPVLKELRSLQAEAETRLRAREAAKPQLDAMMHLSSKQLLPHYAARVARLSVDNWEECVMTLPAIVDDLRPKFEKVYTSTGEGLVRKERGYAEFNAVEEQSCRNLTAHKPAQACTSLSALVENSVRADPVFDRLMRGVCAAAEMRVDESHAAPGGIAWEKGPIKKMGRCVEKLCLDPAQRSALNAADAAALDASSMLDTVRGMFVCNTMTHVYLVLKALVELYGKAGTALSEARLVRCKNRFANPSSGGWMDCLINVEVALSETDRFVCEVQLVHRQLLMVRAELGAHHAYGTYRAALELLESAGHELLGETEAQRKRWVLQQVLAVCVDAHGESMQAAATAQLVSRQRWGLSRDMRKQVRCTWPRLNHLELGGLGVAQILAFKHDSLAAEILRGVFSVSLCTRSVFDSAVERGLLRREQLQGCALLASEHQLNGACVSPDGMHAVVGTQGNGALVLRFNDGALVRQLAHASPVGCVHVSGDGQHVLTGADDALVRVWRIADGEMVRALEGHTGAVSSVHSSGGGAVVVSASYDKSARLWQRADGAPLHTLIGHASMVMSACIGADGVYVATASYDKTAAVWRVADGGRERVLKGHSGAVLSVCMTPDNELVITASSDKSVCAWRLSDGTLVRTFDGHSGSVNSVCLAENASQLLTASDDHTIRLWRLADGALLRTHDQHNSQVACACICPGGPLALTASRRSLRASLLLTRDALRTLRGHTKGVLSVCVSPEGTRVVTASSDKTARVWRLEDGALELVLSGHADDVTCACVSPDGNFVLTASVDTLCAIWLLKDGSFQRKLQGHTGALRSVALTPDGVHVVTASDDKTVRVWLMACGTQLRVLEGHTDRVSSAVVSPDGLHVVTASWDGSAAVWGFADGTLLRVLKGHAAKVWSANVSPDGLYIVTASFDKTACVWRLSDGSLQRVFREHTDAVYSACVSPDGLLVVSTSADKTARVWDLADASQRRVIKNHADLLWSACFSPDGMHVVTASRDGTACIEAATEA
uniref:Uncharacterized protein n=1 Tax=Chrysotila carterae TaxID=13221 RepID=A0A7S4BPZ1_CHRCT